MTPATRERVTALIRNAGFDLVRVAAAAPLHNEKARFLRWIEEGRAGEMRWITPDWARRSSDPSEALPGARSVICVGVAYRTEDRTAPEQGQGLVARYAWGKDYHQVMGEMLELAARSLRAEFGGSQRWFVDTGPAMDKALAARAGLGWYGKNTTLLTEEFGSYVLLGEIITTLEIEPDGPVHRDCGSCRLCIVACPTGALGPDYSIDSRRCISYLTIEHRGPIPVELRPLMGAWVFGCDICQDVCPPSNEPYLPSAEVKAAWRASLRRAVAATRPGMRATGAGSRPLPVPAASKAGPDRDAMSGMTGALATPGGRQSVDLLDLLQLTHEQYLALFRGTSIRRAKAWMLRRNAAVALGNTGEADALGPLDLAMRTDEHEIVRGHAAWALGRVAARTGRTASTLLERALETEADETVRSEIEAALRCTAGSATVP